MSAEIPVCSADSSKLGGGNYSKYISGPHQANGPCGPALVCNWGQPGARLGSVVGGPEDHSPTGAAPLAGLHQDFASNRDAREACGWIEMGLQTPGAVHRVLLTPGARHHLPTGGKPEQE